MQLRTDGRHLFTEMDGAPVKKPCADCGHAFEVHAADVNFPNSLRCFHNAATGEGCRPVYDERCKQYKDPEAVK